MRFWKDCKFLQIWYASKTTIDIKATQPIHLILLNSSTQLASIVLLFSLNAHRKTKNIFDNHDFFCGMEAHFCEQSWRLPIFFGTFFARVERETSTPQFRSWVHPLSYPQGRSPFATSSHGSSLVLSKQRVARSHQQIAKVYI